MSATIHPLPASLVLAGAGKMGGAMLEGWLAGGLPPGRVGVIDPDPSADLVSRGLVLDPAEAAATPPEVLVLAIKPQTLDSAGPDLASFAGPNTLVVSILAGKTLADLARALPEAGAFVRAMPNLPASIGRGATGAYAGPGTTPRQREVANGLLGANGLVEWVDREELIDAVTAVSGSGPAYLFHLVECLAAAGVAAGLEAGLAGRLARATVTGAGALLESSGLDAVQLRRDVTSPGGTTQAALEILMSDHGLGPLMREAVAAAKRRAGELSG